MGVTRQPLPAQMRKTTTSLFRMSSLFLFAALMLVCSKGTGQTNTWDGSSDGNWNTPANWSLDLVPTTAHDVVIPGNATVNINIAAVCNSFTINTGNFDASITIIGSNSLTVAGALTINGGMKGDYLKIIAVGSGTLTCASILIEDTGDNSRDSEITLTTGTVTVLGDLTMDGNAERNGIRIIGAGTLNIGGAINGVDGGDIDRAAGSTVNFNGTVPQMIPTGSAYEYDNLMINNPMGVTFQAGIPIIEGILSGKIIVGNLVSGSVLNTNNVSVTRGVSDTIIVAVGSTLNAGTTSITWSGTGGAAIINGTFVTADTLGFSAPSGTTAINSANMPAIWLGPNSTIEYNAPSPLIQIISQRSDYANVTLTGGLKTMAAGTHTLSGDLNINVTVYNGTTNNPVLNIAGDLQNNASMFSQGKGRINLNGSTLQTIGGSTTIVYDTLVLNNTSVGAQLSSPVNVGKRFVFTKGKLLTTSTNVLIFKDNAMFSANDTAFVNGPVQKVGNDAFTFPVGKGTTYGPISISAPATFTDTFQVEYFVGTPPSIDSLGTGIAEITDEGYWDIDRVAGTSDVSVTMNFTGVSMPGMDDLSNLRVARFDETLMKWEAAGTPGTPTGSATTGGTITANTVTNFSFFTLGSSVAMNALPIELLAFTATPKGETVQLDWRTATELNNAFFHIERSTDGRDFKEIGKTAGAGTSHTPLDYAFTDQLPQTGWNYYRLRQVDFDGQFSYSPVQAVLMGKDGSIRLQVFPNPANNALNLKTDRLIEPADRLEIYDYTGRQVLSFSAADVANAPIDISQLPAGTYFVRLRTAEGTTNAAFVKQ